VRIHEPIAIVGIGCRFPGGVRDAASLWRLLEEGRDAISSIPEDRIDVERYYDPHPALPGHMATRWGGYLDDIRGFDAAFFGISPREAERMDPQQRLVLESAWEALEDAGIPAAQLVGARVGVYVGQWTSDFEARLFAVPRRVDFYSTTGSGRYATSGRVSYVLGLRGPSLTIDTACSSSLAAVHLAVQALRAGECEMALAGGVNVILQPHVTIAYSQSGMMAADGRCKFGDASGDGYVRSEGVGVIALKPLARALSDGDRVYALIRGSALNNDGRGSGSMGTPSRSGQAELLRLAYRDAGVPPARLGYIEAHGTGTRVGDPTELGALTDVLSESGGAAGPRWVGSVKTNFGHTEGAAGVAGLIKAALALYHGVVPASLHFEIPNPDIPWAAAPLAIPRVPTPWERGSEPRVAGVSAFGIAGTNAHVVLEEAAVTHVTPRADVREEASLLVLSARAPDALAALASRYAERVERAGANDLRDLCATAALHRGPLELRAAFAAESRGAMAERLRRFAAGDASAADATDTAGARPRRIAFVFPGQGSQWMGMTRELGAREPVFRAALEACERAMRPHVDWSLAELLTAADGQHADWLDDIAIVQPALAAVEIALAAWWRSLGIEPAAVVGHSMGEVAAAHVAGALSLNDAMAVVCQRSALMKTTRGRGGMAFVELTPEEADARIASYGGALSVAAINAPRSTVLAGDPAALDTLLGELDGLGVFGRRVKVDVASHGPQMDPLVSRLAEAVRSVTGRGCDIPIYSTVTGSRIAGMEMDAAYWARNLRAPVRFGPVVARMIADGIDAFIEMSPHPILVPAIEETARAEGVDAVVLGSLRRDESEQRVLLGALGALFVAGHPVDFGRLYPDGYRRFDLPLYPWQHEQYWAAEAETTRGDVLARAAVRPDEATLQWLYRLEWRPAPLSAARRSSARGAERWLVLGREPEGRDALAGALRAQGAQTVAGTLDDAEALLAGRRTEPDTLGVVVLAPDSPDAAYLPIRTLQAALRAGGRQRLWFVTRGSQTVDPARPEPVAVDQAALWGAARVVAEEHPDLWGGLVDVDPEAAPEEFASVLARHLAEGDDEDQVALRGGQRFALRLARLTLNTDGAAPPWRADGAYLITGGLGDVGLHIARYLAEAGVRRLVLLGRSPLPPREQWAGGAHEPAVARRIAAILALEASGVAVHVASVDVADERALFGFVDRYRREAWPAIRGVIHAAGTMQNRLASSMDRVTFDEVLRAKLRGARLLDRLFPDVDVFVLFSSFAAFLPQGGEANYAAANAALDAVAYGRRARGCAAQAITWGTWNDTGMATGAVESRTLEEMGRRGLGAMQPAEAVALFAALSATRHPAVVALPINWGVFTAARRGRDWPLLRELLAHGQADATGQSDLPGSLATLGTAERQRLMERVVLDVAARVLKIAPNRLDRRRALGSLGLNSLMAMELRNRLESALGRSLSATLAWNYPTVEAMSNFLAGEDAGTADSPSRIAPAAGGDGELAAAVQGVVDLTEEEALLALRAARGRPRP
jgi:acyl transferase domain-containing protein/acyl carrier protein